MGNKTKPKASAETSCEDRGKVRSYGANHKLDKQPGLRLRPKGFPTVSAASQGRWPAHTVCGLRAPRSGFRCPAGHIRRTDVLTVKQTVPGEVARLSGPKKRMININPDSV